MSRTLPILRDARLERGETVGADPQAELVEAMAATHDPDPTVRELAEQATDEVGARACISAWWRSRTGR